MSKIAALTCQRSGWRAVASDWIASSFLKKCIFSALTPRAQNNPHFSQNKGPYSGADVHIIPVTRPHGKQKMDGNVLRCIFQCILRCARLLEMLLGDSHIGRLTAAERRERVALWDVEFYSSCSKSEVKSSFACLEGWATKTHVTRKFITNLNGLK